MKKRVLAALLALIMLFGALPMSVFAEDLETVEEPSGTFEPEQYEEPSGTFAPEQPQLDIPDPTDSAKAQYVFLQCKDSTNHKIGKRLEYLPDDAWEVKWAPGSEEATLKLYPAKIAPLYTMGGEHRAVNESTVTVTLRYTNKWEIAAAPPAIPTIEITCAAPEIPDPQDAVGNMRVWVVCNVHTSRDFPLSNCPAGWEVERDGEAKSAKLILYPDKIAEYYSETLPGHTAVSKTPITIGLTYANGKWAADKVLPNIEVKCEPAIPDPTDYVKEKLVKEQLVPVVCDNKTAHPNIQYVLENLPAGSVDVQWDRGAKTANLVLKPEKIAEHYSKSYGAHTAVIPADVKVPLTYANDAWSLSAAIPDVHVTCKPAQEIPSPKNSFDKLFVKVACNTENSGHDSIEVPLTAVSSSVGVQWETGTATAYIKLTPSIFATYYSKHNNGANGAHGPVALAEVTVEAHYDNEKGWLWTKPTINVKCEPVYTIRYKWRDVVKPTDVKNVNNPETFTADELPITLKAPDFKNNEWPQKFLNWRDADGNVVTQITEPGNVELYAYYQFPVRYTVYDENDQKVDELSVTEWYNEDDFADYILRSGEKTGHDFDGWYQDKKDFGKTNERVTKLYMAKKWELVGKLTRKDYTIAATLYLNGADAKNSYHEPNVGYAWSHRYGGKFGETIEYAPMINTVKAKAEEAVGGNPVTDWTEVQLCYPGQTKLFNENVLTYGQDTANWQVIKWDGKVNNIAYIWARVNTYYRVKFDTDGGSAVSDKKVQTGSSLAATYPNSDDFNTTRYGYNFVGWFTEKEGGEQVDLTAPVTKSMTLYAHWEKKDYAIAATLYLNGADAKNPYHEPNVGYAWSHRYGDKFEETINYAPMINAVKAKAEEAVGGNPVTDWTEVQLCYPNQTKLFNENVLTYGQNTATWQEIEWNGTVNNIAYIWARVNTYYRVKFNTDGGSEVSDKKVQTGSSLAATYPNSDLNTMKPGYTFLGWYTEKEGGEEFKLTDTVKKSMTLYAHWKAAAPVYTEATLNVVCRVKGTEKLLGTETYTKDKNGDRLMAPGTYTIKTPKISGYTAVKKTVEVSLESAESTITVYYKRNSGGSGTYDSPNKPTKKAPALTLNMDDHFAFINGYPNGTVQPEGNVTRAETAAILYRIMGDECQSYYKTTSSSYSDVARGDWYNTYVATLENAGVIVDTRTNGKFRPNDAITRAELASMIAQFAGLESASAAKFNDVGSRYWAAAEIAIAAKMGWINGYPDGSFRPDRNVTRAELMAMVNRALGRTPKSEDDLLSGMKTWRDNANVNAWYYLDVQEATNDHTYTKYGTHETWKKLL